MYATVGAGVAIRSFIRLQHNPGFLPRNLASRPPPEPQSQILMSVGFLFVGGAPDNVPSINAHL